MRKRIILKTDITPSFDDDILFQSKLAYKVYIILLVIMFLIVLFII